MKAIIHFFSGTGNTARAVQAIVARLEAVGFEVARRFSRRAEVLARRASAKWNISCAGAPPAGLWPSKSRLNPLARGP